jgi:hypothetical protein
MCCICCIFRSTPSLSGPANITNFLGHVHTLVMASLGRGRAGERGKRNEMRRDVYVSGPNCNRNMISSTNIAQVPHPGSVSFRVECELVDTSPL